MRPYFSSIPHDPPRRYGDCFRSCVASVLEVPPWKLPHFTEGVDLEGFIKCLDDWCESVGLQAITLPDSESYEVKGYAIALSGRADHGHAAVVKDGVLAHDPDGHMTKIFDKWEAVCFIVSDVTKFLEWKKRCSQSP